MASNLFVPNVVAMREGQGRPPEIIPQQFKLRVRYSSQELVLFRLVVSFADSASTNTTVYLQITADSLHSLDRTDYNKTNTNAQNPPCLDDVYKRLNDMHSVTRLQFRLRSGEAIQLAVPSSLNLNNMPDDAARSTFESAESLAAASSFSLYFQHNVLKKDSFLKYKAAVLPFESITEDLRKLYEDMRDVRRLYNGVGGRVHKPRDHGSPPTRERCSSPASTTTASCGSTIPFDTGPRLEELPPLYDDSLNEALSPRVISDAAATAIAIFAESPGDGPAPPEYGDTKQRHGVLDPFQGVLPRGSEDTDTHPTAKRKCSFTDVCTTWMTARDASRPEKMPRLGFVDPYDQSNVKLLLTLQRQQIELQCSQIEQLQKEVEGFRRWKNELKGRYDDLEAGYLKLENRQDQTDDAIENLTIDVSELEDKHAEVVKQIPDVYGELKDLEESMRNTFEGDICKSFEDRMAKQIGECVEAEADELRRRICQALQ